MEKYFMKLQRQKRNFFLSLLIVSAISIILLFISVWQLILIPGFVAGLINKEVKRSVYSAILSIVVVWAIFMISSFYTKDTYILIDQFAGFIFGGLGFGWVIIIIIFLMGIIFGSLGAAIGAYSIQFYEVHSRENSERRNDNLKQ